ncbi:tRNA (adenosine(37)-N6)-threonylcarbamoyltransferase complex dimerization subunit type 1 TsaB [Marinifilum caeruleilacunae]|uniref:tRNA (Adenosine(37)-N6)-threonylcarbamoyltransferase complex dimerization subunit type 1 TsaB n=1 Tax=Marinifilum caeruleilacunae TaxID=2499076 RepID=A0ABX1WXF8_9BACT|nr:tRNA (adenosine(37)-N6)-threonylcarbamoyltransferase complex dimerization subunit type 1 TsaB [Marinifilum caeruleilacunae]NOU60545.1 tRNA (adenosine(37)-N6)-threonylcarbamoyltransferase complex dimerization subunit type 1 TsaB [Marinifilum caeruleilacunae]
MALLLNIETSTAICSVALGKDGKLLALKENKEGMKHASHLTVFIENILKENNLTTADLDGVAISMGPGSYTGLRIGVSTAKGICYGAGIPLIAVSTLQSMTKALQDTAELSDQIKKLEEALYCPMIDARRMEVYTAFYNSNADLVREISADIIDENSFADELSNREIVFFGDGSGKCKDVITNENGIFLDDVNATALGMIQLAEEKFNKNELEDVAYFEPFYLKDFVATTPKKNIFK